MKFNKKVLIGLLTASCVVAGTFGLAACEGGEQEEHKPEVTIGANGNLFVDGVDTGYKVKDDNDNDNNVGETVTIDYVLQTPTGIFVYYSDGTSAEVPYLAVSLSLSDANKIVLPKNGNTTYLSVNVPSGSAGTYTFDLGFSGTDAYSNYAFTVNEKEFSVGGGWTTSFNALLNEGTNLITITSNLQAESSATLSINAIPAGGALSVGENNISLESSDTYYAFTFTAEEDGDYTVTVPAPAEGSFLCVADGQGEIIACCYPEAGTPDEDYENMISDAFSVKAGETVVLLVMADCSYGDDLEDTYSLTINKIVIPEVTANGEAVTVTVSPDGSSVILNVETAGTYVLSLNFATPALGQSQVLVNDVTSNLLSAGNSSVELVLEAGENVITLSAYRSFRPIEIDVTLTAKEA